MDSATYVIIGTPSPQPRARRSRFGGVYNPPGADRWRNAVALALREARAMCATIPVAVALEFRFTRPASHYTGKGTLRAGAPSHPGKSVGDIDNLIKSTVDAATGILWNDDGQIVQVIAAKCYSELGGATLAVMRA